MQLSTNSFFAMVNNNLASCHEYAKSQGYTDFCLDPSKHENVRNFFTSFLDKHPQFGNCEPLENVLLKCPANDGSGDYLAVFPGTTHGMQHISMQVLNDSKNHVNNNGEFLFRWSGGQIDCSSSFFNEKVSYSCQGHFPETTRYSYQLTQFRDGSCDEMYQPETNVGFVETSCKKGLPLFDEFLSGSTLEEVPLSTRLLSSAKLLTGVAGTLYFGYKTAVEVKKVWDASTTKPTEAADQKALDQSKQRALIYGVATAASLVFSVLTYTTDFAGLYKDGGGATVQFV